MSPEAPLILVVDDSPVHRRLVTASLMADGYRTIEAADGTGALLQVLQFHPRLILADIVMESMDGFEFVERLRRNRDYETIPVVFCSGNYTKDEAFDLAVECGVRCVISKPVNPGELLDVVASITKEEPSVELGPSDRFYGRHRRLLTAQLFRKIAQLEEAKEQLEMKVQQRTVALAEATVDRDRLISILEATPDLVGISKSIDNHPIYINNGGRTMLGIGDADVSSLPEITQYYPEWAQSMLATHVIPAAIQHGSWVGEISLLASDGTEVPVSQMVLAHKGPSGEVEYFSTIARDIRDVKRSEETLRQSGKIEAVGRLAAGLAHDCNGILTVILGHCDLASDGAIPGSSLQSHLDSIKEAGDRAAFLIRQLLAFSRQQVLQPQTLDIDNYIEGIACRIEAGFGKGCEVVVSLNLDSGKIWVDPAQIEIALTNLATNAKEAMMRGGVLRIETGNIDLEADHIVGDRCVPAGAYITLEIRDNGSGMNAETLSHLFEPFFTTKHFGSGGLGLSTVYGIISQSGGYVTVESDPGIGTAFILYFPRIESL